MVFTHGGKKNGLVPVLFEMKLKTFESYGDDYYQAYISSVSAFPHEKEILVGLREWKVAAIKDKQQGEVNGEQFEYTCIQLQ